MHEPSLHLPTMSKPIWEGAQDSAPLYWKTANTPNLFDDLIRPRKKFRRKRQADLLRRFQVDNELKLRRLLYRQIGRFRAF